MSIFFKVSSWLLVAPGTIHTALTPVFEPEFSSEAVWFAGTGLAVVWLGLLNLTATQATKRSILTICLIANLIGIVFGIVIVFAVPEPQASINLVLFVAVTIGAVNTRKNLTNK